MDADVVIQLISNLGFPVVMCGALFYYMVTQRKAHTEEMEHLRNTLEDNTRVLTELSTLIKLLTNGKN